MLKKTVVFCSCLLVLFSVTSQAEVRQVTITGESAAQEEALIGPLALIPAGVMIDGSFSATSLLGDGSGITNINAANVTGNGSGITNINAANVTGTMDLGGDLTVNSLISNGNVGIGTATPAQKLSVAGTIESTTGGIKFPDGTVQTTAVFPPSGPPKAPVLNTGQLTTNAEGDDGHWKAGAAVANRFTDNLVGGVSNGTVTDNLTGLIWLKNANCFDRKVWADALTFANGLASGACGLTDGSVAGDWRLPNRRELRSLVDYNNVNPPLPAGHPFTAVQTSSDYWSSTTYVNNTGEAWLVNMGAGTSGHFDKLDEFGSYVWPVRGGQ